MSDTPRTDAIAEWGQRDFGDKWIGSSWHSAEIVPAEFCRDVERELAAKSAEVERLRADARRYQWVIRQSWFQAESEFRLGMSPDDIFPEDVSRYIDDVIKEPQP